MAVSDIILLGNPLLYEKSKAVSKEKIRELLTKYNFMFKTCI